MDAQPDPSGRRVDDPATLCVSFLVRHAWLVLRSAMDSALTPHGLSIAQYATLLVLDAAPGSSVAEVGRVTASTRQAANELIGGLVEQGLVERHPHPTDRRSQQLYLTATGQARLAAAAPDVSARETEFESTLDPAQREAARAWLRAVSAG